MADENVTKTPLELADVIRALRQELINAQQVGQDEKIRFNVNNVEVELETIVEKEAGGKSSGKIRFWVVDADAEVSGKYKKAARHKIKLSLQPVNVSQAQDGKTTSNALQIKDKA